MIEGFAVRYRDDGFNGFNAFFSSEKKHTLFDSIDAAKSAIKSNYFANNNYVRQDMTLEDYINDFNIITEDELLIKEIIE